MKRKKMVKLFSAMALTLLAVGTLTACGGGGKTADADVKVDKNELKPYGKYDEPVEFTIGKMTRSSKDKLSDNESTRFLTEQTNIKMKIAWEVGDFDQKFALALSTKDIPDVMVVNATQMQQLIDNDLIADLTEVYDKAASDNIKKRMETFTESDPIAAATRDGKLYAIPGPSPYYEQTITWLRKDWIDQLNLKVPETIDELGAVLKAFQDNKMGGKDTVGLSIDPLLAFDYGGTSGVEPIANQYGAFPNSWINKDGKAVYGSVQPEMKEALTTLSKWYKDGVIDKEFATRTSPERKALLTKQSGVYMAPWWAGPDMASTYAENPDAEWIALQGPVKEKGDKFIATGPQPSSRFIVVRKGYEHPEAVMRAFNNQVDYTFVLTDEAKAAREKVAKEKGVEFSDFDWFMGPIDLYNATALEAKNNGDMVNEAVKKRDRSTLPGNLQGIYDQIVNYEDKGDIAGIPNYLAFTQGVPNSTKLDQLEVVQKAFWGTTETMKTRNTALKKLEQETFVKIIMGNAPVSEFDKFVEQWHKMGGDTITEEVNKSIKEGIIQ